MIAEEYFYCQKPETSIQKGKTISFIVNISLAFISLFLNSNHSHDERMITHDLTGQRLI